MRCVVVLCVVGVIFIFRSDISGGVVLFGVLGSCLGGAAS